MPPLPVSFEMVRIIHERQLVEHARRYPIDPTASSRPHRSVRMVIGSWLVCAGAMLAGDPALAATTATVTGGPVEAAVKPASLC